MKTFKEGDKVRVVQRLDGHRFCIGHVGIITEYSNNNSFAVDDKWWLSHKEVELVEPIDLPLPRKVLVSTDGCDWRERTLVHILPEKYERRYIVEMRVNEYTTCDYVQMKELPTPEPIKEYTMEEAIKLVGHEFKIKK